MGLRHIRGLAAAITALAVAACVSAQSWEAVRVLKDVDARGGPSDLKAMTPAPTRTTISYRREDRASVADLYEPHQPIGASLVLVPGFTPQGKNDPRLVDLAFSLARARFLVLVPDLRGSKEMRVRLEDVQNIVDAAAYLAEREAPLHADNVGVVAISYAVGLAVLATMQPQAKEKTQFLVGIGAYYDITAVVTFITTGRYREPNETAWRTAQPEPAAKWIFLASNINALSDPSDRRTLAATAQRRLRAPDAPVDDLAANLGPEGRSLFDLLMNTKVERVEELLRKLPVAVRRQMETLSLRNYDLSHLAGRLILIHGREDRLIPYTESLSLKAAVPDTELFIIDGFSHIDTADVGMVGQLRLVDAIQAILSRRQSLPQR
ncbi:MAG: alpha/beta fold hydrolase [Alphaproteobacteria bacterium]